MTITATQTTVLLATGDLYGDGLVDPGNTIVPTTGDTVRTTTVTISNTAGPDATNVPFNETSTV